ncbi:TSUP family transporter [Enterovirga sp.]|uniref:TSUP family transporter n=1 Tax=Enterovirga sp. TaxID=2026350 RepID=UPI002C17C8EF|nr:TSUP family transporter [Enterovirga sp.]HMO28048.1 TSUP family transporter [Enterovirga sp.]
MSGFGLVGFLLLTGFAAYAQTLTGFAFGLITMGGVGLSGLLPLPEAAVVVSLLTLVNAGQMLLKGWRDVAWREFGLVMVSSLPAVFVGFRLLGWLAAGHADVLRLVLGLVIIVSSIQLARNAEPRGEKSGAASFLFFGVLGGLMGGLFSTAGPPLVYHFYRQPLAQAVVRETLVTIFALNALLRLGLVAAAPAGPAAILPGLLAVPAVLGATYAARRFPPPISKLAMRRLVFILLFLSGVSLGAPAALRLAGHLA